MAQRWMVKVSMSIVMVPLAAAIALGVNSSVSRQSNASSAQQQMIDLQKQFIAAQERGDAEYVKNALADDFVSIETNGNVTEKVDFVRDIHPPERPTTPPTLYEFKVIEVDSNCAVVTYEAVYPGNQLEKYQRLSDTWVKEGNRWKLKFQQSTLNLWSAHDLD